MRGLLNFLSVLSVIVTLGALSWAGMATISSDASLSTTAEAREAMQASAFRGLLFAGGAVCVFVMVQIAKRRME